MQPASKMFQPVERKPRDQGYKDVPMTNTLDKLTRLSKFLACIAIAVFVVWRAYAYTDPKCVSALPQIMCAIFAVSMAFTGLALANNTER